MKIETYLFGSVDIDPEKFIHFEEGFCGFSESKDYFVVHEQDNASSFTFQSVNQPYLAFQVCDPAMFGFDYQINLDDEDQQKLGNPTSEETCVLLMIGKNEDGTLVPNVKAPILLNFEKKKGLQKILLNLESKVVLSNFAKEL